MIDKMNYLEFLINEILIKEVAIEILKKKLRYNFLTYNIYLVIPSNEN